MQLEQREKDAPPPARLPAIRCMVADRFKDTRNIAATWGTAVAANIRLIIVLMGKGRMCGWVDKPALKRGFYRGCERLQAQ